MAVRRRGVPASPVTAPAGRGVGRPRKYAATLALGSAAPARASGVRASSMSGGAASSRAWRVENGRVEWRLADRGGGAAPTAGCVSHQRRGEPLASPAGCGGGGVVRPRRRPPMEGRRCCCCCVASWASLLSKQAGCGLLAWPIDRWPAAQQPIRQQAQYLKNDQNIIQAMFIQCFK